MHRAAREDNVQACRILVSHGVDPSIVSLQGYTALQVAGENVHKVLEEPPPLLDLETQLLEASKAGDLDTVQRLLIGYPHIVNCRDMDGR